MITQYFYDGSKQKFYGLSSDTKPSGCSNGSIFVEMDTQTLYMYNATANEWCVIPFGIITDANVRALNSGIDQSKVEQIGLNADIIAEIIDSGSKNVLNISDASTVVDESGVTFTVNSDYSITCTGKNNTQSAVFFNIPVSIPKGNYKFSGMPENGASSTYRQELRHTAGGSMYINGEEASGRDMFVTNDWSGVYDIRVAAGYDFGEIGKTIKPMVCSLRGWAYSQKYVPYVPSMAEMYAMIKALQ